MLKFIPRLPRVRNPHPVPTVEQVRVIRRERLSQSDRIMLGLTIILTGIPVPAMALSLGFALFAGWFR